METVTGFQWEMQTCSNWVFLFLEHINRNKLLKWAQTHFNIQTSDICAPCTSERNIFRPNLADLLRFDHEQQFTVFKNYNILQKWFRYDD